MNSAEAWLVYDGECPFCSRYVRLLRIREHVALRLVNAREGGTLVRELSEAGLDLNDGMVLKFGDRYYHGADCIHMLAVLSTSSTTFNRVNARIFGSPTLSRLLYPILRLGRNSLLAILGRQKLPDPFASDQG